MKQILIATDFSEAARGATRYAIRLAAGVGARVSMVSAYESLPIPLTNEPLVLKPEDMEQIVLEQLTEESRLFSVPGLAAIDMLSRKGSTVDVICKAAGEIKADLIVTGMKKSGKGIRRVFGSTVTGLANKTAVPLLVIPEGASFEAPVKIVIANDLSTKMEMWIPEFLLELAAQFRSRITVIRFLGNRAGEVVEILDHSANLRRITGVISPLDELPAGRSATDALSDFLANSHGNMLAMPVHHRSLAERWLGAGATREMIFESPVAFLLLPENNWY